MIVVWLFLTVPQVCQQFVLVVFHDHTHLIFLEQTTKVVTGGIKVKVEALAHRFR